MPILRIAIVLRHGEGLPSNLARRLADATGAVFGSPPGHTWIVLSEISGEQYAENHNHPVERPSPVFAHVLRSQLPAPEALAAEAAALAAAIAQICGRPAEQVHIIYEPAGAGRVAFGGVL